MARKTKKTQGDPFFWKAVVFIVKLPYYIVKSIYSFFTFAHKKTEEMKVQKKRQSIDAIYEELKLLETKSGDFKKWEKNVLESDSKIGIILGARGTGKSAIGIKFLENIYARRRKKCYAMGFTQEDLPSWIDSVEKVEDLKNDSFVLIDEGGVLFSSRDAMSKPNKLLSDIILVARHKNLSILFISQNSANLEVNVLRQADYLILKPSSLLQLDFERKKIKEIYQQTLDDFERLKDNKGLTYIYSDQFRGFITNSLPSFWTMNISKSFKK